MTDTLTEIPDFPMQRAPGCPFAPPPKALELNAARHLNRVRIWDGSTPWLITGYEAIRSLFADARASVDDRKMRLAVPIDELPFKHDALAYGMYELPVTW